MTSIVSAVPAGEVMAREEVFGTVRPREAQMATTIGVVRLPGRPPTQCLSAMGARSQLSLLPVSTMARVRAMVSDTSSGRAEQAVMKEERWMSE